MPKVSSAATTSSAQLSAPCGNCGASCCSAQYTQPPSAATEMTMPIAVRSREGGRATRSGSLLAAATSRASNLSTFMRLTVTGGAGFVGSNVACALALRHPDWEVTRSIPSNGAAPS